MTISIQDMIDKMEKERVETFSSADKKRAEFIQIFCTKMVNRVLIEFAGSGDSGSIDDIIIEYVAGHEPAAPDGDLRKEIETWAHKYLEGCGVDWYNNEGGQGTIEFDMRNVPFAFRANIDVNEMISSTAYETEEVL